MEDVLDDGTHYDGLQLTAESRMYLAESAKWAKFLAIIGFVMMGLMALFGLFFGTIMGTAMSTLGDDAGASAFSAIGGFMSFIYIGLAVLFFFPFNYQYKFATRVKAALVNNDTATLTDALMNQKSMFKFWGIYMIVMLCFYGLGFLLALLGGVATAF